MELKFDEVYKLQYYERDKKNENKNTILSTITAVIFIPVLSAIFGGFGYSTY